MLRKHFQLPNSLSTPEVPFTMEISFINLTHQPNVIKLLCLQLTYSHTKLECLSRESLPSLTQYLQVRQGAYLSEAPSKCSIIGQAASIALKYQTKQERPARYKHSSFLSKLINYGCKKFYDIDTLAQCDKILHFLNLLIFILSQIFPLQ